MHHQILTYLLVHRCCLGQRAENAGKKYQWKNVFEFFETLNKSLIQCICFQKQLLNVSQVQRIWNYRENWKKMKVDSLLREFVLQFNVILKKKSCFSLADFLSISFLRKSLVSKAIINILYFVNFLYSGIIEYKNIDRLCRLHQTGGLQLKLKMAI